MIGRLEQIFVRSVHRHLYMRIYKQLHNTYIILVNYKASSLYCSTVFTVNPIVSRDKST